MCAIDTTNHILDHEKGNQDTTLTKQFNFFARYLGMMMVAVCTNRTIVNNTDETKQKKKRDNFALARRVGKDRDVSNLEQLHLRLLESG